MPEKKYSIIQATYLETYVDYADAPVNILGYDGGRLKITGDVHYPEKIDPRDQSYVAVQTEAGTIFFRVDAEILVTTEEG